MSYATLSFRRRFLTMTYHAGALPPNAFKARYGLLCLGLSFTFSSIPPSLSWLTANLRSTGAATLAVPLNVAFGQLGQIIGRWLFRTHGKNSLIAAPQEFTSTKMTKALGSQLAILQTLPSLSRARSWSCRCVCSTCTRTGDWVQRTRSGDCDHSELLIATTCHSFAEFVSTCT